MGWSEQIRVAEKVKGVEDTFQRKLYTIIKRLKKHQTYKDASIEEMKRLVNEALGMYERNVSMKEISQPHRTLFIYARENSSILRELNKKLEAALQNDDPLQEVETLDVASDNIDALEETFVSLGQQRIASNNPSIDQQMEAVQDRLVELESRSMVRNSEMIRALHAQLKSAAADVSSRTAKEWQTRWFGKNAIRESPGLWWMDDERPKDYYHLNVMSWNILASSAVKWHHDDKKPEQPGQRDDRHKLIIEKIKAEDPDVVLLQEVDAAFVKRMRSTGLYRIIFQLPAEPPLQVEDDIIINRSDDDRFGNAILYNWKLDPVGRQKLIWNEDSSVYDRKNAIIMNFKWYQRILSVASFHLSGRSKHARKKLWRDMIQHPKMKRHAIIGGDFNQAFDEAGYSTCAFDYGNDEPALIDKIAITDQTLRYEKYEILNLPCQDTGPSMYEQTGSDHFPILARIEVLPGPKPDYFDMILYRPSEDILTLPVTKRKKKKKKKKQMEPSRLALLGFTEEEDEEERQSEQMQTLAEEDAKQETSRILLEALNLRRNRIAGLEGGCCIV